MPKKLCCDCHERWCDIGTARCAQCAKAHDKQRNANRGGRYGIDYRKARAMWVGVLDTNHILCARGCGYEVRSDKFHLDHLPDGQLLPSHPTCNIKGSHTDGNRKPKKL